MGKKKIENTNPESEILGKNTRLFKTSTVFDTEEAYKSLVENSGTSIIIIDIDGIYQFVNRLAASRFGRRPEEIIGRSMFDFLPLETAEYYLKRNKKTIEAGVTVEYEDTFNLEPGIRTFLIIDYVIKDTNGKGYALQSSALDITSRIKAEAALKESEAEYRSLFENSIMGISQAEPGGKLLRINTAYARMYGYPDIDTMLNEVTDIPRQLYSDSNDRKRVLKALDEKGSMEPTEFELIRRNGEKFWALVSARKVFDDTGKLLFLQAEHIDITARKKLEKDIYFASIYARNLIEASIDPLVTIDKEGKITDVNKATEEITGCPREKLIGSSFPDYFTKPEKAKKGYNLVFSNGTVRDFQLTILHTNGKKTDVLYNASLFRNENGDVQGVFAAARDITGQKKLEKDLRNSKDLLERLNQHLQEVRESERSQIALNLHDDFGQRFTALNLDLAWLKSRIGVQSMGVRNKFEEMSLMINESIESIREISSFLRPSILYELGLIPALEWQLKKFKEQSGINFTLIFNPEKIKIDDQIALILFRVLQESLTNIIRHSEANFIEVDLQLRMKKIELKISDNGKGIEEEKINSPTSLGINGLIERIRSINGTISIKGIKDKGTILKISIPITLIQA